MRGRAWPITAGLGPPHMCDIAAVHLYMLYSMYSACDSVRTGDEKSGQRGVSQSSCQVGWWQCFLAGIMKILLIAVSNVIAPQDRPDHASVTLSAQCRS